MKIKNILNIKSFHILFIPETGSESKSKKVTSNQFISAILLYTFIVAFLGFVVFRISPVNKLMFPPSTSLSSEEIGKIEQLNQRLYFLTKELEGLKSTNERLKYAIMLGDSTLIDSAENNKPVKKIKNKVKEGNLLSVIKVLLFGKEEEPKNDDDIFFIKPVNGFLSRDFLPDRGHPGIDLVVKTGTPVYSSATGYIVFSGYTTKDGYMVIINHANDYISIYKHCSSLLKKERDLVLQGELIALSGNTGEITTGPHLHFEIWRNGKPIDPKTVFIKTLKGDLN